MSLTASQKKIFDAFLRETSSNNSYNSLEELAKVFSAILGQSSIIGQIEAETSFPGSANVNFNFDFSGSFGGLYNIILENITMTGSPEKFIVPEAGKYHVSYFATINATQNIQGKIFPTLNGSFLNNYYYTAYGNTYSGLSLSNVTFGKSKIMELQLNDQIGLGGNFGSAVILGASLSIIRL